MARYIIPYPGINESIKHLKKQIVHSLPYVVRNTPGLSSPEKIFNYCKDRYTYKNDPSGIELFQTVGTLLDNNYHSESGAGDCDDATIFTLTMLIKNGFKGGIVLVGRNPNNPTHIYTYCDNNGQKQILDLTNKKFNVERPYPFKQYIPLTIPKDQLNMFLQLAEGPNFARRFRRIKIHRPVYSPDKIYLPSKGIYVPFKKFDNLPVKTATQTMLSEGYGADQLSEYLSGRAERRARRKERADLKTEKKRAKVEKKKARVEVVKARAEKKQATAEKRRSKGRAAETRAEAKRIKAENQEPGEETQGMKLFNKAGELVKTYINRGGDQEETDQEETDQEETETETPETETTETDENLEDSQFSKSDIITAGAFLVGLFLEGSKKLN